jgi:hypothetical protein
MIPRAPSRASRRPDHDIDVRLAASGRGGPGTSTRKH